uniref:AAA+ ATPase domain-containing protein n=1 Tax=Kalanchoe fedtschenkoi TaxID=63787 RepID=A0A7N0VGV2_KALFE
MTLRTTFSSSVNTFTAPFFTQPTSRTGKQRVTFRKLATGVSRNSKNWLHVTLNSRPIGGLVVRSRVKCCREESNAVALEEESPQEAKRENCVENVLNYVAKSAVIGLFCIVVGFLPFRRGQVRAIAAPWAMRAANEEREERHHEYAEYTKRLLQVVSELIREVEEVRKGSGDIGDVEKALKEVKLSKRKLEGELLNSFYEEFEKLKKEKEELMKRSEGIIDEVLKVKRNYEVSMRTVEEGSESKELLEIYEETLNKLEEEYKEIWEKTADIDDQMRRKETRALSIGYRELAFIERESKQLVDAFRIELRKRNMTSLPSDISTKLSRCEIKQELLDAQKRYIEQLVLPSVVETEEIGPLFDQESLDFVLRIKNALNESRELQRSMEALIKKDMKSLGDEKRYLVNTPVDEVLKGFPEVELKWMFGDKEVVVPKAVKLHLFHGWKKWREEAKSDLKRNLLENADLGKQYVTQRQERTLGDRDRVDSKVWYNVEWRRWEMDPIALPYVVSRKIIDSARIRHDWGAMYVFLKGEDREYYINLKEYDMLFEDFGGFDALYLKMVASGIPTAVRLMWIPLSELNIFQQFLLAAWLTQRCFTGFWNYKYVAIAREWLYENIKNLNDDIMMMVIFPLLELVIPYPVRIRLGMAWPEEIGRKVGSTWYLQWQSDAEASFRSRQKEGFLWHVLFIAKSIVYGYVLFHVLRFLKRKVPRLLGYGPLRRDPNFRKLRRVKAYIAIKIKKIKSKKKAGVDPISTAFDQMKRVKNPPIPLKDFASVDSMRAEIDDVVAFLQNPHAYQQMGVRPPRGVLIVGERGTGKTSLALAIAAEAKVPVVEVKAQQLEAGLWVGQSASNVRELFQTARDLAPVIIFVEDFDLFAGVRGTTIHTKKQDHEAFINQLLVELDGFQNQDGVVVMATTRNLKHIDEALRRPGRMDRIFHLQRPTQMERERILHLSAKETMDEEVINFVDWKKVAEKTALLRPIELKLVPLALEGSAFRSKFLDKDELMGYCSWFATFSNAVPAWLRRTTAVKALSKMLVNHLGLNLTKDDMESVVELMEPYGQISNGIELLNPPLDWTRETKLPHAVWAAGRSLIAALLPNFDDVDNLWLEPFSWEGIGCTKITKAKNEGSMYGNMESRSYLEKKLVFCFGSYIAAQLLLPFGEENLLSIAELDQAQEIATRMVIEYGWAPDDSPAIYYRTNAYTALSMGNNYEYEMATKIEKIYDLAFDKARDMLLKNRVALERIVEELLEFEILTGKDLEKIVKDCGVREKEPFSITRFHGQEVSSTSLINENESAVALLNSAT